MVGLVAALIAIALGVFGPRFRWLGAILLGLATISTGSLATFMVQQEAIATGLRFGMSFGSVAGGLALQTFFMLASYAMAAGAALAIKALTRPRARPPIEQ
jgi:hypothetical protein